MQSRVRFTHPKSVGSAYASLAAIATNIGVSESQESESHLAEEAHHARGLILALYKLFFLQVSRHFKGKSGQQKKPSKTLKVKPPCDLPLRLMLNRKATTNKKTQGKQDTLHHASPTHQNFLSS